MKKFRNGQNRPARLKAIAVGIAILGGGLPALSAPIEPWLLEWGHQEKDKTRVAAALSQSRNAYQDYGARDAFELLDDLGALGQNEEIAFWRAWYAHEAGMVDEAEEIYRDLIRKVRKDPKDGWPYNTDAYRFYLRLAKKNLAYYHSSLGHLLASKGYEHLEEATIELENAVKLLGRDPAILHSYAYILQKQGYLEEAMDHYEKALDNLEGEYDEDIFFDYGAALLYEGEHCKFGKLVEEILGVEKNEGEVRWQLGALCLENYRKEMAGHLADYLKNQGGKARPTIFHALMLQGMDNYEAAEMRLDRADKMISDSLIRAGVLVEDSALVDDLEIYGFALEEAGRAQDAEKVYRRLISIDSKNPWYYSRLGCLLADEGREFEESFAKALDIAPDREEFVSSYTSALSVRMLRVKGEGEDKRSCRE